jgi:hypothetical protein
MPHRATLLGITLAAVLLAGSLQPADAQDVRLTGQIRPRFEQRDPAIPTAPAGDVTMRARIGAAGTLPENIRLRIDVQDVIIWGATSATPGFTPGIEVHQAFIEAGALGAGFAARLGRQELIVGNQRLVSNNNWGQRGQRYDGVRLLRSAAQLPGSGFAMRIAESGRADALDAWLHGVHTGVQLQPGDTLVLLGLYDRERGPFRTDQFTLGGHGTLTFGGLGVSAEAYLQRGTRSDRDVSAWMYAFGAQHQLHRVRLAAAWEHYSGDPDHADPTTRVFDRRHGSNHAFHGYADLFTNIPGSTAGRGLTDALASAILPLDSRSELELKGHVFRAAAADGLMSTRFGEELDVVLRHRLRAPLALEAGGSHVWAGPALSQLRGLHRNLLFGYAMATLTF